MKNIVKRVINNLYKIKKKRLRREAFHKDEMIRYISKMPVHPISRDFGKSRGKSIARVYIDSFLEENKGYIQGDVLEIAENTYTLQYGKDRVKNSYILHVNGWGGGNVIKGDLATGEGIEENKFDTAIITHTLMHIYNIENVAQNIHKLLKKGGTALITVAGISKVSRYDANNWGHFFGFYEDAMKKMFFPVFGERNVIIKSYGNVKTVIAMMYGMCYEELSDADFTHNDEDYPVVITVLCHKE